MNELISNVQDDEALLMGAQDNDKKRSETLLAEKTISQLDEAVRRLCEKLKQNTANRSFNAKSWTDELEDLLQQPNFRLMYSTISYFIFEMSDSEFTNFSTNLDSVMKYAVDNIRCKKEKQELYKVILKFSDHATLANHQKGMIEKKRSDLHDEMRNEMKEELATSLSNSTKELTSQLVGLVALFTAMSFIVFGGIASLDSIFKSANRFTKDMASVLPVLIVAIAWAFCMMNLLFGFMYFVLRLVKPDQFSSDSDRNFVQKFPVVVLTNYILVMSLVLFGGMWFAKYNGIGLGVFNVVVGHPTLSFWTGIFVFGMVFCILGCKLWSLYRGKEKTVKQYDYKKIAKVFGLGLLAIILHMIMLAVF